MPPAVAPALNTMLPSTGHLGSTIVHTGKLWYGPRFWRSRMHGLVEYRDGFSSTSAVSTQNCIHAVEYEFLNSGLQLHYKDTRSRIKPHVPRTRLCLFSSSDHSCHVVLLCRVSSIDGSICIIVGLSLSDVSLLFHHRHCCCVRFCSS
jgi:hypothetical protein